MAVEHHVAGALVVVDAHLMQGAELQIDLLAQLAPHGIFRCFAPLDAAPEQPPLPGVAAEEAGVDGEEEGVRIVQEQTRFDTPG